MFSYSVSPPLPDGLVLDPVTGAITGTPAALATASTYTVTAANPSASTTVGLGLTVEEAAPPGIVTQPANKSALRGSTATFAVVATGFPPLTYQWRRNGLPVAGARSASYTTPSLVAADDRSSYSVVVTDGLSRSVASSDAVLTLRGFFPTGIDGGGALRPHRHHAREREGPPRRGELRLRVPRHRRALRPGHRDLLGDGEHGRGQGGARGGPSRRRAGAGRGRLHRGCDRLHRLPPERGDLRPRHGGLHLHRIPWRPRAPTSPPRSSPEGRCSSPAGSGSTPPARPASTWRAPRSTTTWRAASLRRPVPCRPRAATRCRRSSDGTVLVAGGRDAAGLLGSADRYDPNGGIFTRPAPWPAPGSGPPPRSSVTARCSWPAEPDRGFLAGALRGRPAPSAP